MGPEIGVASTKSFTGQMICFLNMVLDVNQKINTKFSYSIKTYISDRTPKIKEMAKKLAKYKSILIMGRKYNYPIALEGALKLKEITYIHTEGFSASEMKHGVIALVDESLPILYMLPNDSIYSKNSNNYEELKSRKANIFMLGNEILNSVDEHLIPFYYVIEFQLLTYYIGLNKGTTIDKPRNLAKSVTVE
jgi:glucosamine--fructose-6-phosphate aminotransferase (isomerizing)